jgi:hypothetical protein
MKTRFQALLAVTLATTPALAFPKGHPGIAKPRPAATKPAAKPAPTPAPPVAGSRAVVAAAPMQPRTLPTGAPACGNVQSKMSPAQRAARDAACAEKR